MKYISEFRNRELVGILIKKIKATSTKPVSLMEVCGGHTMAIQKYGIPSLLPETITLLSGPGCPVCVTDRKFIDIAIAYAQMDDVIITTYGDLIRVPGSSSTLDKEKAAGADVRIVFSTLEALKIATENPSKKIIFPGIGFETTIPGTAAGVLEASKNNIKNFFVLSSHKIMPPAMAALIHEGVNLNGYICPGHVSTITGSAIYNFIPEKYGLSCVIAGFEPTDILQSIYMLVKQFEENTPKVEIQYSRVVKPEGNTKAQAIMNEVFTTGDDWWRGLGVLPNSGMKIKPNFNQVNIEIERPLDLPETHEPKGCICGEILKGLKTPAECKLFNKACTPVNPIGACMVSNEGACAAYYKYKRN